MSVKTSLDNTPADATSGSAPTIRAVRIAKASMTHGKAAARGHRLAGPPWLFLRGVGIAVSAVAVAITVPVAVAVAVLTGKQADLAFVENETDIVGRFKMR